MAQIAPQRRPHYGPVERMAILELRAWRGWSLKQTADTFLVTPATIASWVKRIDENGSNALLQLREPVNKFPDFVRYIVQRLKILSPSMGKVKIAETLCRAGLHLGVTTVGRILTFGAVGQHGSIALIDRFILSLKNECTRIILVPLRTDAFDVELTSFANWRQS